MRSMLLWMPLVATGCLREVPRGPYLGDCAEVPAEGSYSWGDVGIGSCLAGPADVRFLQQGDRTLLAVSNANPYFNFSEGSVLLIDYDSIDLDVDLNLMHELDTWALPLLDDDDGDGEGNNPFLGQIGVLPGDQLLVPSRFTEDGVAGPSAQNELRAGRDHAYLIDASDLGSFRAQTPREIPLRDDPMPVVVDDDAGLAYVVNLTDHSLSVLTTDPVERVDVAPGTSVSARTFDDLDDSGSLAELARIQVFLPRETPDDAWTLTFIDGTTRLYVAGAEGIVRHESPGDANFREVGFGEELRGLNGALALDPFVFEQAIYEDTDPLPFAVFAETILPDEDTPGGAGIRRAQPDGYAASNWLLEGEPLLLGDPDGYDRVLGGPSLVVINGLNHLFYDGRPAFDEPSCIFLARSEDGIAFSRLDEDKLFIGGSACGNGTVDASYEEVAHPFVAFDPLAGRYRMWFSAREQGQWVVALTESDDGTEWSPARTVLSVPGADIGGPAIRYMNGRYILAAASDSGDGWATVVAESADGVHFDTPVEVVAPTDAPQLDRPLRPGLLAKGTSVWRIEGRDFGPADLPSVAGTGTINVLPGFGLAPTAGHEVSNDEVPAQWAANGLVPGSVVDIGGVPTLYATTTGGGGLSHVVALQDQGAGWEIVEPFDRIDDALATGGRQAASPVVVADDDGYVMFYAHIQNGVSRIRRATSSDGLQWSAESRDLITEEQDWDAQTQEPHSVEVVDGRATVWFAGDSTSRVLIGAATSGSLRGDFARQEGPFDPWLFSTGVPGSFDDSGVKDPLVLTIDGERHLFYAGFDGVTWSLGHAIEGDNGEFERRIGLDDLSLPAMRPLAGSFSGQGITSPTLLADEPSLTGSGTLRFLFAGDDGFAPRLGAAVAVREMPDALFHDGRRPTVGDTLSFTTTRGGGGVSVIELGQEVDAFVSDGIGVSSATLDPDRGMIYVTSKLSSGLFAVDIRDDSAGSFVDANVHDIETVIRPLGGSASQGFTSTILSPSRGLLYATAKNPDGLWVFDLDVVVDDDRKEDVYASELAILPLPDLTEDAGDRTAAPIGGAGMALTDDEETLLVTHFRDNSLFAYDLSIGAYGEPVAYLPYLGENPHLVRIAPDGRTAVVANYVGDVVDDLASSTLVVIDIDRESETYLEPLTWIGNL